MSDYLYNKDFAKDTIQIMLDEISDLEKWSAHNDDKHSDQIQAIKVLVVKLKEAV